MGSSTGQTTRRRWGPLAAVAVVLGLLGSLLVGVGPASAAPTTTTLAVAPSSPSEVSELISMSATVTPSEAQGWVIFYNGDIEITGYILVVDGQAVASVEDSQGNDITEFGPFPVGEQNFRAEFTPMNENWDPSVSPIVDHSVVAGDLPVLECVGATQALKDLLASLIVLKPAGGVVVIETPISGDVPATIPQGLPSHVDFTWTITIPDALVGIAEEFGAESYLSLQDIDMSVEASGAATGSWFYPVEYPAGGGYIADPTVPIVLTAGGQVTGTSQGEIDFAMVSGGMTVFVPKVGTVPEAIDVILDCEFIGGEAGTTLVDGVIDVPDAPTGATAIPGPGQATVSWTAPADDGGAPITGYVVEPSAGGAVNVGPEVTSIDVIGLSEGSNVSFTVTATNAAGDSPESAASNTVMIGAPESFSDVPPGHPFFKEIAWMAATGLSTGYDDGSFKPGAPLARQAMSAFIYRINGSPLGPDPTCTTAPFVDVPADHVFCGEIAWMADEGISTGFDDNTYRPQAVTTRQAMSAFLYRSANGAAEPPACTTMPFNDVPIDDQFCPQIAWMAQEGISTGYLDGSYKPADPVARQALSAFLYRYTLVVPTTIS